MGSSWIDLPGLCFERSLGRHDARGFKRRCLEELVSGVGLDKVLGGPRDCVGDNLEGSILSTGPSGCASCLQFSPEGSKLATATADCKVQIFQTATGRRTHNLEGHTEIVTSLVWMRQRPHRETEAFFTSSLDKTVRLWMNYKPRAVLRDHCDWIRCLGLSSDDSTVASGCVSSNVVAWDVETGRLKFKVSAGKDAKAHHAQASRSSTFQRSINSLQFSTVGVNVFATGIRDGSILLWDARSLSNGPVLGLKAHLGKLNQIQLGHCDNLLLSGGRDGAVRLWDMRKLGGIDSCAEHVCPPSKNPALRMEYKSHRCTSYNISCVLLNYDRYIATGSEDRKVWIYDACTGKTVKVLEGHSAVAHFVHTPPETDSGGLLLASSSIDSSLVNLWSPAASMDNARPLKKRTVACLSCESPISCCRSTNMQESEVQGPVLAETAGDCQEVRREVRGTSQFPEPDEMVDPRVRQDALQKKAVEELMHKHGDIILRVFHHYDYSFRSPFDWQALLNHVRAAQELHLASNGSLGAPLEQTLMNSLVEIANDFQEVLRRFTERQAALPVQPV